MTPSTTFFTRARRLAGGACSVLVGLLAAGLLLAIAAGRPAQAGSGIDVNPGQSIQAAINTATPGQSVFIHAGVYTESLTLSKTVSLIGDGSGTTIIQAMPGQRVITVTGPSVNGSVLIADLTLQGGVISGSTLCPLNCGGGMLILTGTTAPQLHNLVFRNNAAHHGGGLFSGASVTITGGLFTNNSAMEDGGGLYLPNSQVVDEYQVVLSGTQFISNTSAGYGAGAFVFGIATVTNGRFERNACKLSGPVFCYGGGLVSRYLYMTNTDFYTNVARFGGGGAYNTIVAHITGGIFQGNSTYSDGGGLLARGVLVITGTRFISNTAETGGGGLTKYFGDPGDRNVVTGAYFERNICTFNNCPGGGLRMIDAGTLEVRDTDFVNNTSSGSGGGLSSGLVLTLTGGLFQDNTCTSTGCGGGGMSVANMAWISGIEARSNQAGFGGGGAFLLGESHVTDALFQDNLCNATSCRGGGIHAEAGLTLTNTLLIHNTSVGAGGGLAHLGTGNLRVVNSLFTRNDSGSGHARGLWYFSSGNGLLLHTTFANPTVLTGSAVAVELGHVALTNTIVASYTVGINLVVGTVSEDYTLFFGVASPYGGSVNAGTHHPAGDPQFVNPAVDDYRLRGTSPARDAGTDVDVDFDVDGDARPLDDAVELGYDEFAIVRVYLPITTR